MLYRHNDAKSEGDGERERQTDTYGRHCLYECDRSLDGHIAIRMIQQHMDAKKV